MKLAGHREITKRAVAEFVAEYKQGSGKQLTHAGTGRSPSYGPEKYAVMRDIIDVVTTGHWSNFAQKHHFMRRFDGQSPYEAYEAGCKWIRTNSLKFAKAAAQQRGSSNLAPLGYAMHCLEDSFAFGHCEREAAKSDTQPGAIVHVKMYSGHEKKDHSHHDTTWKNKSTGKLSSVKDKVVRKGDLNYGTLAKNSVKALLYVIFDEVAAARTRKSNVQALGTWSSFQRKWLAASPKLSKERNKAYDMIDKRYNGFVWGNTNHALNFDESGMAKDIYEKLGTNTADVKKVFERLNEYHTTDADDVAEIYVNKLRQEGAAGRVSKAVSKDRQLSDLLIKILDEGPTFSGEQACIDYLKKIRK